MVRSWVGCRRGRQDNCGVWYIRHPKGRNQPPGKYREIRRAIPFRVTQILIRKDLVPESNHSYSMHFAKVSYGKLLLRFSIDALMHGLIPWDHFFFLSDFFSDSFAFASPTFRRIADFFSASAISLSVCFINSAHFSPENSSSR